MLQTCSWEAWAICSLFRCLCWLWTLSGTTSSMGSSWLTLRHCVWAHITRSLCWCLCWPKLLFETIEDDSGICVGVCIWTSGRETWTWSRGTGHGRGCAYVSCMSRQAARSLSLRARCARALVEMEDLEDNDWACDVAFRTGGDGGWCGEIGGCGASGGAPCEVDGDEDVCPVPKESQHNGISVPMVSDMQ